MQTTEIMTSGEAARLLGLSRERVIQLDADLQPQRTVLGRRIYARATVEAYAARRQARRVQP